MTREETHTTHYTLQAVQKAAISEDLSKLGKLKHSIGKYDGVVRATVPVIIGNNLQAKFFLLLSFDIGTDVKVIIEKRIVTLH